MRMGTSHHSGLGATAILPLFIFKEKESYLARSTSLIKKSSKKTKEQELCELKKNVEYLAKDFVSNMGEILEFDKEHNLNASANPNTYPFDKTQKLLEKVMHKIFQGAQRVLELCETLDKPGCQIDKDVHTNLKSLVNKFRIICTKSEEMYETDEFKELVEQAERQIQDGNVKVWP